MKINKEHFLILLDIKQSSQLLGNKASSLQNRLLTLLEELNRKYKPLINLQISYGDEIGGIFTDPVPLYEIVDKIRELLYPETHFRFVAVKGKISVHSQDIRQVGGEIFKKADREINQLKKENRFSRWLIGNPALNVALTSLSELSNAMLTDMTEYQYDVYLLLKRELPQKNIARKLQKHTQSVSDAAKRGKAELVIEAGKAIQLLLLETNQ